MASDIIYSVQVKNGIKKWGVDWKNSLAQICEPEAMQDLAKGYRYYINKYVPKKSGTLRKSAHPVSKLGGERDAGGNGTGSATVYWGDRGPSMEYAHYQFVGDIYGPNRAIFFKQGPNPGGGAGVQSGWYTPVGKGKKWNTHRKLGSEPGSFTLDDGRKITVKGYTTKGTKYNWIKEFKDDKGDTGETAVNIRAGRYMYERFCVKQKIKPYGGAHIYHSWNQIKNIVG